MTLTSFPKINLKYAILVRALLNGCNINYDNSSDKSTEDTKWFRETNGNMKWKLSEVTWPKNFIERVNEAKE